MDLPNNVLLMIKSEEEFSNFKNMVHEAISPDCSVDWVTDHVAGLETVAKDTYDFWFIDSALGSDVVCDVIGEGMKKGVKNPFVILYNETEWEIAQSALNSGAAYALNKQHANLTDFKNCVRNTIARQHFVGQERRASDQLIIQNQELNELCKTAQEYAGHVSYKIRTPLTVIKAFAAILADGVAGQLNSNPHIPDSLTDSPK